MLVKYIEHFQSFSAKTTFFSSDNISLKGGIQGLIQELADTKKNPQKHKPKKHAAKTYTGTTYIT